MKNQLTILILSYFLICSCKSEINNLETNKDLSPIWEKDFQVGQTSCINPVLLKKTVIFSAFERNNFDLTSPSRLISCAKADGEIVWEWKNRETDMADDISSIVPVYAINNNLYFSLGPRCYAINALNGQTIWFKSIGDFASTYLLENNQAIYYLVGQDFSKKRLLIDMNLQNGDSSKILEFISTDSVENSGHDFIVEDEVIYYINGKGQQVDDDYVFDIKLVKYDRITNSNIYEVPITDLNLIDAIQYLKKYDANTLLAVANKQLISIDESTGELKWLVNLPSNQFTSDIVTTSAGILYIVTEDNLMCINVASGSVIWDVVPEHLGLNSRMVLHKGVLYFVSGGQLNAFDASNGDQLMSLTAPSKEWSGVSDNFQSVMTLDAENDRIYTASYTAAYCYPTLNLEDL